MEKLGRIIHPKDAKVFMDEQELVREYVRTDKITFGVSRLKPGAVGGLDTGHAVADEISHVLEALVGTAEEDAPKAEPKHPVSETTSKFTNLQFGRNYDPTKR